MAWIKKKTLYPATILIANLYFIYISIKRFWSDYLQRKLFVNMFSPERENYKPRLTCHLLRKLKCFMGLKFSKYLPTTGKWGSIRQIKSQYDDWYIRQMYPKLPQIYTYIFCAIFIWMRDKCTVQSIRHFAIIAWDLVRVWLVIKKVFLWLFVSN